MLRFTIALGVLPLCLAGCDDLALPAFPGAAEPTPRTPKAPPAPAPVAAAARAAPAPNVEPPMMRTVAAVDAAGSLPALVLKVEGQCPFREYEELDGVCAHELVRQLPPRESSELVAQYRRAAAAPLIQDGELANLPKVFKSTHDEVYVDRGPGSLMQQEAGSRATQQSTATQWEPKRRQVVQAGSADPFGRQPVSANQRNGTLGSGQGGRYIDEQGDRRRAQASAAASQRARDVGVAQQRMRREARAYEENERRAREQQERFRLHQERLQR